MKSLYEWQTMATVERAETDAGRAHQQNISIEELRANDEKTRIENLHETQSIEEVAEEREGASAWQQEQDYLEIYGTKEEQDIQALQNEYENFGNHDKSHDIER